MRHFATLALFFLSLGFVALSGCDSGAKGPVAEPAGGKPAANQPATSPTPKPVATPTPKPQPVGPPVVKVANVLLSKNHEAMCLVKTGDQLPAIQLPDLTGKQTDLASLYGKNLTVVFFWSSDHALARMELADLQPDVAARFGNYGVNVVGIAIGGTADSVQQQLREGEVSYPVLLDTDGKAFAKVGHGRLPRTFLIDGEGRILWFDIEYSRSTRRELQQAIKSSLGDAWPAT